MRLPWLRLPIKLRERPRRKTVARVAFLSGLKTRSFPAYRIISMTVVKSLLTGRTLALSTLTPFLLQELR